MKMLLLLPYDFLQVYSWVWISVLAGLYVFFMFSYGGAAMMLSLGKNDAERTTLLKTVVNKWWCSFVVLALIMVFLTNTFPRYREITKLGVLPPYHLRFGFMIVCAICCEILLRVKNLNKTLKSIITHLLVISGWIVPTVAAMTVISIFTGLGYHFTAEGTICEDVTSNFYIIRNPRSWFFAATWIATSQTSALMCLNLTEWDYQFRQRIVKHLRVFFPIVIILFIIMSITQLISSGYNVMPDGTATYTATKYIENITNVPVLSVIIVIGFFLFFFGLILALFNSLRHAVFFYASGIILVVVSFFMLAGLNNTSFIPSNTHPECSLTIHNSSADQTTLQYLFFASIVVIVISLVVLAIHIVRYHNKSHANRLNKN